MKASPSAPLCEMKPTFPDSGMRGAKVAFRRTPAAVLTTPRQLGPTSRTPPWRQTSSNSR